MLPPDWKTRKWELKSTGETHDGSSDTQRSPGSYPPSGFDNAGPSTTGPVRPDVCGGHEPQAKQAGGELHGDGEAADAVAYVTGEPVQPAGQVSQEFYRPKRPVAPVYQRPNLQRALAKVELEILKGETKHGMLPVSVMRDGVILAEEVAELQLELALIWKKLITEIVDRTRPGEHNTNLVSTMNEAVQVAAVAIRLVENILDGEAEV